MKPFFNLKSKELMELLTWVPHFMPKERCFVFCRQVYMAREIETSEIVALKKIRMDNEREGVCFSALDLSMITLLLVRSEMIPVNYVAGNKWTFTEYNI